MLTDSIGRQFNYLRLSITDVCNFKCNYCLPEGYSCDNQRNFLSLNEIQVLLIAFARLGMKKVRITGGEPAQRKDLGEIIHLCKQTAGIQKVALTTNGFNLLRNIKTWQQAGLDALNVSIDSLDPALFATITGCHKLNEILKGVELAQTLGIPTIKINTVLLKQFNHQQLGCYLSWLKTSALTIRFIELMETGNNRQFFNQNHVSGEKIKQQLQASGWQPVIRHNWAGPAEEFFHPDYVGRIGLIMPYSKDFCRSCNRLRVSSLGQLHLCLFAEQGIDLRSYLRADDITGCSQLLQQALQQKKASHQLLERQTGATTHLAMLGG